jgi:phosphoglycolate phosphatase-like HAD superfamily hydrolase
MHICLFDIDGTLLNTGGAGQSAMEAALRELFETTRPVVGISAAGRTDYAITTDLFAYYKLEPSAERWQQFVTTYLRLLPDHLKRTRGCVLPGVPGLLETLSARDDLMLGLLTGNFRDGAWLKLQHYELHRHFQFGGFGDHHLHRDDVAREALQQVRRLYPEAGNLDCIWVIGDTPSDIRCARAIGARVIAVATGIFPMEQLAAEEPDHLFRDLSDPEPILSLLC